MKKITQFLLIIVIVFALMTASAPDLAIARPGPTEDTSKPLIAGGSWTSGTDVNVTALAANAPTWLQLLTNGVYVTEAGKICHPFRGGQFGWVGEIHQYKDGQWNRLGTTNDWVPDKEGEFMSCAQAPSAGTYALFGYWIRPAGYVDHYGAPPATCGYSTTEWTASIFGEGLYFLQANLANLPTGTLVTYNFTSQDGLLGDDSGSDSLDGSGWVTFSSEYIDDGWESVDVELSALGCSRIITINKPIEG